MTLELKNIGMIKEANVKIDGLTVIAGKNDTGKSTVGKALFLAYSSFSLDKNIHQNNESHITDNMPRFSLSSEKVKEELFSENSFSKKTIIKVLHEEKVFTYNQDNMYIEDSLDIRDIGIANIAFIETPIVWNLQKLFRSVTDIESHLKLVGESIEIPYPFLMKDLYFKLVTKRDYPDERIKEFRKSIISIIDGEFKKDEDGLFRFYRDRNKFDLIDVATG
ncbi:MAG: hypothetical protein DSZ07_01520, partial [Sulfurovum sp.]